ncbi:MAG: hypothetical protein ACJ79R_11360 [Anaeromyxobacteraceae bacterium]
MQQSSHHVDLEVAPQRRAVDVGGPGDLALAAAIFAVAILPIVGVLAGSGHWGAGALGLGAAGAVFAGREIWAWVAAAIRRG